MLQILSGRFFENKQPPNEAPTVAVLFSNWSAFQSVETSVGTLKSSAYASTDAQAYVFHYVNRYERSSPQDPLFLPNADEAVEQFRVLCCLWFRAIFHPSRSFVESLVHTPLAGWTRSPIPAKYIDRYFDVPARPSHDDIDGFQSFIQHVLSLPRKKYRRIIASVRAFVDSLEALGSNFDVAYSMLVYLLEAVSGVSDSSYQPTWDDYEEGMRRKIEKTCHGLPAEKITELQSVLLSARHLKLKKRFVEFILTYTTDEFFTSHAHDRTWAIRKSEMPRLLSNLYDTRSGYVHELKGLLLDLRMLASDRTQETGRWQNEAYLTYAGLVRLARHVLISFIRAQQIVEREEIDWRGQLPGTFLAPMAPQYWIHRIEGLTAKMAKKKYSGVIEHVIEKLRQDTAPLVDLRPLMNAIETLLPTAETEYRPALVAMYWLFNGIIPQADARPEWEKLVDEQLKHDTTCRIEYLAVAVIFGGKLDFTSGQCEAAYRDYVRQRHKASGLRVPATLEVAILCHLANRFLEDGERTAYDRLVNEAITDSPGQQDIQRLLQDEKQNARPIDVGFMVTGRHHPISGEDAPDCKI